MFLRTHSNFSTYVNGMTHSTCGLLSKVALYAGREMSWQTGRHPASVSVPVLSLLNKPEEQTQTYKGASGFFLCLGI